MLDNKKIINLETERLILRPININDANQAYLNWCSDNEVSKYMIWTTHKSIEETKEWLKEEKKYKRKK